MVHQIIPLIDSITAVFDRFIDNQDAHPAVRHAAFRGLLVLNKYYQKTDDAVVYRIAMRKCLDCYRLTITDFFPKSYTLPSRHLTLSKPVGARSGSKLQRTLHGTNGMHATRSPSCRPRHCCQRQQLRVTRIPMKMYVSPPFGCLYHADTMIP